MTDHDHHDALPAVQVLTVFIRVCWLCCNKMQAAAVDSSAFRDAPISREGLKCW